MTQTIVTEACPVGARRLDQRNVRITAGLVTLVALTVAAGPTTGGPWIAAALAVDFALRALGLGAHSPVAAAAGVLRRLGGAPVPIDAAPKEFAAGIGALMSAGSAAALLSGAVPVGVGLIAVLGLFAFLEAALAFCAGCVMYTAGVRVGLIRP